MQTCQSAAAEAKISIMSCLFIVAYIQVIDKYKVIECELPLSHFSRNTPYVKKLK